MILKVVFSLEPLAAAEERQHDDDDRKDKTHDDVEGVRAPLEREWNVHPVYA